MYRTTDPAALAECIAPLDEENRRAVRQYWERVIREEWVPPSRFMPRAVPLPEDGRRERREARRAIARIAAAGRLARVHVLPTPTTAAPMVGKAA